jgi:hypothetical protein
MQSNSQFQTDFGQQWARTLDYNFRSSKVS